MDRWDPYMLQGTFCHFTTLKEAFEIIYERELEVKEIGFVSEKR